MTASFGGLATRARRGVDAPTPDSAMLSGALCDGLAGADVHDIETKTDSLAKAVASAFDRRYAASYITVLNTAKASYARIRDSLASFRVESAHLEQESGFLGLQTTIVMTVYNGTGHTVKRAYFSSKAVSPGREVPWIDDEFNHSIPGGLAPGERATWHLQPNMFAGEWNRVRVPSDARFVVDVVKLDGPDDAPLFGGAQFTPTDQRVLDSLGRLASK